MRRWQPWTDQERMDAELERLREVCPDEHCSLPDGHGGFHVPLTVLWQEAGYVRGPWYVEQGHAIKDEGVNRSSAAQDHAATIRRVLMGQWADNDARLEALKALEELEAEVERLQREAASRV